MLHNLETAGVRGYFSAVIGGDQVTHSKPEPEICLKAAAALDTPPGLCMVLEDSYNGVRAVSVTCSVWSSRALTCSASGL